MCKLRGNHQRRGKKKKSFFFSFAITENRSFIFRDDGIIITRSASYLCIRGWVIDFNDSFSLGVPQSDDEVSRIKSRSGIWSNSSTNKLPWRRLSPPRCGAACDGGALLSTRFGRTCTVQELSYLPLFLYSFSFHPILWTPSPLSSRFSFYPFVFRCWWKDSRRNRTSTRGLRSVPVIRLISRLPNSVSSHRLMSCAWHSWLVWLPFVCLRFYYLAAADRFYL